ncbi:MAG: LemA family protein [Bacteroidales bacterium]|nr:LemA family protein [Bacteroidales bacterium]
MSTTNIIIILAVCLLFFAIIVIGIYNKLVRRRNESSNAFASIDAMLKKRYDLIPNMVAAVQKYMEHERSTLNEVTDLRTRVVSGNLNDNEKVMLDNKISKAMGNIMLAVENYPELKASANFEHLQRSLNEVEEQLSASRRAYNAAVTQYNNSVQMFPSNIVAAIFGFEKKQLFEILEIERQNVSVKNLFN